MNTRLSGMLTLTVAFALTTGLQADEKKDDKADAVKGSVEEAPKKAKQAEKKKGRQVRIAALNLPKTIELSEEQQEKLAALREEYSDQYRALNKKMRDAIPADIREARRNVERMAKATNLPADKLEAAKDSTAPLTDEMKAAVAEVSKARQELNKEVRGKVMELLTKEQKASLRDARKKNSKSNGEKKSEKADATKEG